MNPKTTQYAARVSEAERYELKSVAELLDIPEAQIIREAVREKLAKLRETDPRLSKADLATAN